MSVAAELSDRIVGILRSVCPDAAAAALHEPFFGGRESDYLRECIETGWVSSVGKFVDRFEADLAAFTGVARAVAVVNGTAALHMCLHLVGVRPDDEVIVPTLTFVGTANAVAHAGAVPHFADSEMGTLGMDPSKLDAHLARVLVRRHGAAVNRETGRRIAAVVPVHIYGHPVDLDAIAEVCEQHGVVLVEDAAESIGTWYKRVHTGGRGRVAALSFNGNKTITTGGGGAILTNDKELGRLAKHLTTTAKRPHSWRFDHDQVGWNYRMPNLNAALGSAQLEQLPAFLAAKRALAQRYRVAFEGFDGARFFVEPPFACSNYWLNVLLLDDSDLQVRDAVLAATHRAGIGTRPAWTLMHRLPMYASCPRMDVSVAEDLERRIINLPSGIRVAMAAGHTPTVREASGGD